MSRRGWTPETIKAGDQIKVVGQVTGKYAILDVTIG